MLVIIFFITSFSTCKKNGLCANNNTYVFVNNFAKIFPDRGSINVGDTIWIEFNLPVVFEDTISKQMINYRNSSNFGNFISEAQFTGGSISDPGAEYKPQSFEYILLYGKQADNNFPTERQSYYFIEQNNNYTLKVGIIPKSQEIFALSISDAGGVYRKNNICTKATFLFQFMNTNQHLYLYQNNRPGYIISDYEKKHMYCFKVY